MSRSFFILILYSQMQCHASPIYTLARNPSFFKNFLTVGDWNARIWSEDCKESSIIWTKYCSVELTDGCWSPTKCSLFYLSRTDGSLEAWDLLQQQSEPIMTIKVCFIVVEALIACQGTKTMTSKMELVQSHSRHLPPPPFIAHDVDEK